MSNEEDEIYNLEQDIMEDVELEWIQAQTTYDVNAEYI